MHLGNISSHEAASTVHMLGWKCYGYNIDSCYCYSYTLDTAVIKDNPNLYPRLCSSKPADILGKQGILGPMPKTARLEKVIHQ